MRTPSIVFAFLILFTLLPFRGVIMAQSSPAYDIVPRPVVLLPAPGEFTITAKTAILYPSGSVEMKNMAQYLSDRLFESTGKRLAIREGSLETNAIVLIFTPGNPENYDESYTLGVSASGITIGATKPEGIFQGIQSLRQMLASAGKGTMKVPAVIIADGPRYPWRGISFDCARHFVSKEMVKRYIDLLAYHKMNVFHWHLTDDQGWRIEIKKYPKLTTVGAWRDEYGVKHGGFYTQDEAREVVAYAKSRYITVVPEIEMPGHGTAALAAYPELSCTGEQLTIRPEWGVFPNLFCAGKEGTFTFLEDVLTEVMAIFPSQYIHIGGDEAAKDNWKTCPLCQKRMKDEGLADEEALQGWFSRRMDTFIRSKGRTMIGWDEILAGKPSTTAIVESWRGMQGAVEGAAAGHRIISAPSDQVYFDYPPVNEKIQAWWMPVVPMETTYAFQATPKELTPEQANAIMGAECAIWTERVREYELDYKIFPRLCAFSETVWTPEKTMLTPIPEELRDWTDFSRRMTTHSARLKAMGVDLFSMSSLVGNWDSGKVGAIANDVEWNVTKFITKPGYYRFTLRHDTGLNGVKIESAALMRDGREIANDTHPGLTGDKKNEDQNYYFRVNPSDFGKKIVLRARMSADGGADTAGSVLVRYFAGK